MPSAQVSILNYGVGNLGSVRNMFKRLGVETADITSPDDISSSSRLLLPGVGAFDHGMDALNMGNWVPAIRSHVSAGKPLLGICLGMQLLLDSSEEGVLPGFGFVPGSVKRFEAGKGLRVPHMGWNIADPAQDSRLFDDLDEQARFYFVHSYYALPTHQENILSTTDYGHTFASGVVNENVMGTQFHPEKSHQYGMKLLENFSKI